jgi:SPP1 family predicted phage head-tail adaptor
MPKVSASGRKIYVTIQQDTGTADSQGGHTPNWTTVTGLSHVPVEFLTLNGYQLFNIKQLYPKAHIKLKMRYRGSVAVRSGMRAVYGNHIYDIQGAENSDQANDTIILYCDELQAKGSVK